MNIFGLQITRTKALSNVPGFSQSLWGLIREPFAGAWQRNMEIETRQNITAFSPVYACIDLIANDIAKLRLKLMQQNPVTGIWQEVRDESPFRRVLRKPNAYQTRFQFVHYWITSKLLFGNAYILKERESVRGIVRALYCLDPRLVTPLVADDGGVWYRINADSLSGVEREVTVPASEMIHDRCATFFHPLVGVSPIFAAGASATQGIRIQVNSERFFRNMSAPSGHLTAPGKISDETAARLKREAESVMGGENIGRLFMSGDGLKYERFSMPAVDAQLIEQLRWTAEDIARPFHVPLHKINAGALPQVGNMAALNQDYYAQAVQPLTESAEDLLTEGLDVEQVPGKTYGIVFDLDGLLRMDPISRAERLDRLIKASVMSPDEARATEDLPPVAGGDSPMAQQQNYSLQALAKRDAKEDPFESGKTAPTRTPAANDDRANAQAAKFVEFMDASAKATEAMLRQVLTTSETVQKMGEDLQAMNEKKEEPNQVAKFMKEMVIGFEELLDE